MNPNEYWLVCMDGDTTLNHMITLEQWGRREPLACGKRWKVLTHATYHTQRMLTRKRCDVCFVLSCLE